MSWQEFVDNQLMVELSRGNRLTSAAITGLDGLVWAQSAAFSQIKPEEMTEIVKGFDDSAELAEHGIHLGGTKYMLIQGDPGAVIRGKKGQGGMTIKKTHSALVIGIYDEPVAPGECNVVVEKLGDYLMEQGI